VREGFDVFEAKNGKEGLEIALAKHPDIILLDIIMPVMDGMTMLTKLREDVWGADAKVFILTNLSDTKKVADAITQGSYDYLVKTDWTLEDIIIRIRERLAE
jgi:two-component system OmpR family response regulator